MPDYLSNIRNGYRRLRNFAKRIRHQTFSRNGSGNSEPRYSPEDKSTLPNRKRWGDPKSYSPHWSGRAKKASGLIPDGASILEIGVGAGDFRNYVQGRCSYEGADLAPLEDTTLILNLDTDLLPAKKYDFVVLLGVLEYLYEPENAARKVCAAAPNVVCSYCCRLENASTADVAGQRGSMGWVNDFTRDEFVALFAANGFAVQSSIIYNKTESFEQVLMHFQETTSLT
jgi:hypothetical protein